MADSEEVQQCGVDLEEGTDGIIGDFGVDLIGHLCGGDHFGGIRSGGDRST